MAEAEIVDNFFKIINTPSTFARNFAA